LAGLVGRSADRLGKAESGRRKPLRDVITQHPVVGGAEDLRTALVEAATNDGSGANHGHTRRWTATS
jgi:hypothetical protein